MREQDPTRRHIKRLLWIYFWLLIFEGALRKWVLTSFSDPLLIVRDPVVIAIYYLAWCGNLFPNNGFMKFLFLIAIPSFFVGLLAMGLSDRGNIFVPLFGFRANFLHLPLIFIISEVMDHADINRLGRWVLLMCIPMAILMAMQFHARGGDWLNLGAGEGGRQIDSIDGKIRPSGTFSFVTGVVTYLALVTAFLVRGVIENRGASPVMLIPAGLSLAISLAVSGSRSAVYSAGIVAAMLLIGTLANRGLRFKTFKLALFAAVVFLIVTSTSVYNEGLVTTLRRFAAANANESMSGRFVGGFLEPFLVISDTPIMGVGLGAGTNVGAKLMTGKVAFQFGEGEWSRVIQESGPLLGMGFLVLRCSLAFALGRLAVQRVREGDCLPLLLFGVCLLPLVNGQFGQPSTVGFAVFSAGMCLAASRREFKRLPRTQLKLVPA